MNCTLCAAEVDEAACFCSRCGELLRAPPPGAPVAGPWRAILEAEGEGRDTVFGAPAVALPGDDGEDEPPVWRPRPTDEPDLYGDFDGDLEPPEGFRETAWFLDGEDPDALSAIENRDLPADDRIARYRPENVVVPDAARRRLSLAEDEPDPDGPEEDP